eukprot:102619-Hanusia_phi.AAC.1
MVPPESEEEGPPLGTELPTRHLTTLSRNDVDYDNYAPLIEVVATLLLPSGKTRALRVLVDTGATDNFIHESVVKEFKIKTTKLEGSATVTMGTEGSEVTALGECEPVTMAIG